MRLIVIHGSVLNRFACGQYTIIEWLKQSPWSVLLPTALPTWNRRENGYNTTSKLINPSGHN